MEQTMNDVVIMVEGGVIQSVATRSRNTRVVVINWDELDEPGAEDCGALWQSLDDIADLGSEAREQFDRALSKGIVSP